MKTIQTNDGKQVSFREASPEDAETFIAFTKTIFGLPTVLTRLDEFDADLQKQRDWIRSHQEDSNKLILAAFCEGKMIGLLDFSNGSKQRIQHNGEFGISVAAEFRRNGIARLMIHELLRWARANPNIEKVALKATSNNPGAIRLYKELGFEQDGVLRREIKLEDGTFRDTILMSIFV